MSDAAAASASTPSSGSSGQASSGSSGSSSSGQSTSSKPQSVGTKLSPGNTGQSSQQRAPQQTNQQGASTEVEAAPDPYAEVAKQKYRVSVDGQDRELTVEELARDYNIRQASMKRFEEAAAKEKQVEKFFQTLLKDPKSVLASEHFAKQGFNLRQFAESIMREHIEQEMLTPEQRAQAEKDRMLEEYKRRDEESQKTEAQKKREADKQAAEHKFSTKFQESLEASKLPKSPFVLKRMVEFQRQALKNKYDFTPQELGSLVREEISREVGEMFSTMEPEVLSQLLGEDTLKKIREFELKRVEPQAPPQKQVTSIAAKRPAKFADRIAARDFSEQLRKQFGI